MKSFLQLVEEKEKTEKPVVMAFGRMNPPTTGHMKLIDKVKEIASKSKASHKIIVSHSQDSKKNPLSGQQKIKHLKRFAPDTNVESSSKETPTIMHHASKLHDQGHDHLTVVAGSDRVKEYHDLLHKYNGVKGNHGYYNFKKIEVKSAGHRDPDAEGAEGMSASKMREHAKNNDIHSFKQGVPSHVKDTHTKELMKDVRHGMGITENVNYGLQKAIFVTGGPGSGKDVIIRECIPNVNVKEYNYNQIKNILGDKANLAESIKNKQPLVINGPADDIVSVTYIKEELEELGYETMMVFVSTTNEVSVDRNNKLKKIMSESIRNDKWKKSQKNNKMFCELFDNMIVFSNNDNLLNQEQDLHEIYHATKNYMDGIKDLNAEVDILFESEPTLKVLSVPKESKFNMDNDKEKNKNKIFPSNNGINQIRPDGLGQTLNTRAGGASASAGAGLGSTLYREQKSFKQFIESIDSPGSDMGLVGVMGGADKKEQMVTPMEKFGQSGITINKKINKRFNKGEK